MTIKTVTLLLDTLDGNLEPFNKQLDELPHLPFYLISFIAKSEYCAETVEGALTLRRRYLRQLLAITRKFITEQNSLVEKIIAGSGFDAISDISQLSTGLVERLNKDFAITDNIELNSLELAGNWPIYSTDLDRPSSLKKQLYAELNDKLSQN